MNIKNLFFVLVLALFVLFQFSCSDNIENNDIFLDQETILPYQELTNIENTNMSIIIDSIEEARCPSLIDCIWAGVVNVYFTLNTPDGTQSFSLCLSGDESLTDCNQPIEIGNFSYKLIEVNPYPETDILPVSYEDYEATILVSEL